MRSKTGRGIILLAVQRLGFLKSAEKTRLLSALDAGARLERLGLPDLEALAGRKAFRGRIRESGAWNPEALLASAKTDALLLEKLGAIFLHRDEESFPAALREIPDPPFGLYFRGKALPEGMPPVAIVGTRYPTGAGLSTARRLAFDLAEEGFPIVSGLARGIDAEAHRGALDARRRASLVPAGAQPRTTGITCAVLPCGVERVYPAGNRGLAAAILEAGGLLVSEYPPGAEIHRRNFPERNRLISGLSRGVIVVEAPAGSGALITADFALEQGRDVFAAASRLGGSRSAGLDGLVSEGARAIASAREVLEEWGFASQMRAAGRSSAMPRQTTEGRVGAPDGASSSEDSGTHESCELDFGEGGLLAAALRAELGLGTEEPRTDEGPCITGDNRYGRA